MKIVVDDASGGDSRGRGSDRGDGCDKAVLKRM